MTNEVFGGDTILATQGNDTVISTVQPTVPFVGQIWVDVSGATPNIKKYNGVSFVTVDISEILTTRGDMVYASAAKTPARLAASAIAGRPLVSNGTDPNYAALTTVEAVLGGDVSLTTAGGGGYTDIVSVSCSQGTWLLMASITINFSAATNVERAMLKLWDGTTTKDLAGTAYPGDSQNEDHTLPLIAIVAPGGTTTYKVSGIIAAGTVGTKAVAQPVFGTADLNASRLIGVKIG